MLYCLLHKRAQRKVTAKAIHYIVYFVITDYVYYKLVSRLFSRLIYRQYKYSISMDKVTNQQSKSQKYFLFRFS